MSTRVRLVLLFSLSAIGALAFFGFIAYDTASDANHQREVALLRQAFAPLIPRLSAAVQTGRDIDPLLARWSGDYRRHLAISVIDADGNVLHASPNYRRFLALNDIPGPRKDTRGGGDPGLHIAWLTFPVPSTSLTAHVGFAYDQSGTFSYLQQMRRSLIFTALIVVWLAGWAAMYISRLIEKLHEQKEALRHQALHDTLTDLANRSLLCQRLEEAVSLCADQTKAFSLCFIDLNRFKEVNDTRGHLCGDMLLVTVGERLKRIIRKRDTVARLGGDEFAVVLHDVDRPETETVVAKMIRSIEEDILIDDSAYSISCSVGVAMYPDHGQDPQTLLMHADIAMYEAKGNGLAWRFFEQGLLYDNLLPSEAPNHPVCILQESHG